MMRENTRRVKSHTAQAPSPSFERRPGLTPMMIPAYHQPKSRTPVSNNGIDLTILEVLRNNNHSTSPHRFARALGIPDVAARHLLNGAKTYLSRPQPRRNFNSNFKGMGRGPSIYDLPDGAGGAKSRHEFLDEDHQAQQPARKSSLYDLILKNTSSRQQLYTALAKQISKDVEEEQEDSYQIRNPKPLLALHYRGQHSRKQYKNERDHQNSRKSPKTWGNSVVHLLGPKPKSRDFATLLSERTAKDLLTKVTTLNQRAVSLQRERLEKRINRNFKEPLDIETLKKSLKQEKLQMNFPTAPDTLLPSLGTTPYNQVQKIEPLASVEGRIRGHKESVTTEAHKMSQSLERDKQGRKLPFSKFYQQESGKIRNYFGDPNTPGAGGGLNTPIRNTGQLYAKKIAKMKIGPGGRISKEVAHRSTAKRQEVGGGGSVESREKTDEEENEDADSNTLFPRGFGVFSIGRLAGSRTKLDADIPNISSSKFKSIREVSEQIQHKTKQQTSQHAMRISQVRTAKRNAKLKTFVHRVPPRSPMSITDMVEMKTFDSRNGTPTPRQERVVESQYQSSRFQQQQQQQP